MKTLHYTPHSSRPTVLSILFRQYVLLKHHDSCRSRSLFIQHENPRSSSLTNELQPINKTMRSTMLLICERPATKRFTSQLQHLHRIIGFASIRHILTYTSTYQGIGGIQVSMVAHLIEVISQSQNHQHQ